MYTIHFTLTNTKLYRLSLKEMLLQLSDHYARVGYDDEPIFISDSETGELYEVIESGQLIFHYKVRAGKLKNFYNILDLLDLICYI